MNDSQQQDWQSACSDQFPLICPQSKHRISEHSPIFSEDVSFVPVSCLQEGAFVFAADPHSEQAIAVRPGITSEGFQSSSSCFGNKENKHASCFGNKENKHATGGKQHQNWQQACLPGKPSPGHFLESPLDCWGTQHRKHAIDDNQNQNLQQACSLGSSNSDPSAPACQSSSERSEIFEHPLDCWGNKNTNLQQASSSSSSYPGNCSSSDPSSSLSGEVIFKLGPRLAQQLPLSNVMKIPRGTYGQLVSCGSSHHPKDCTPCWFFDRRKGCADGVLCTECHFPHPEMASASKRRMSEKKRRAAQQQREHVSKPTIVQTVKNSFIEWFLKGQDEPISRPRSAGI